MPSSTEAVRFAPRSTPPPRESPARGYGPGWRRQVRIRSQRHRVTCSPSGGVGDGGDGVVGVRRVRRVEVCVGDVQPVAVAGEGGRGVESGVAHLGDDRALGAAVVEVEHGDLVRRVAHDVEGSSMVQRWRPSRCADSIPLRAMRWRMPRWSNLAGAPSGFWCCRTSSPGPRPAVGPEADRAAAGTRHLGAG